MTPALTFTALMLCLVAGGIGVTLVAVGLGLRLLDPGQRATPYVSIAILLTGITLTAAALVAFAEPLAHLAGV